MAQIGTKLIEKVAKKIWGLMRLKDLNIKIRREKCYRESKLDMVCWLNSDKNLDEK